MAITNGYCTLQGYKDYKKIVSIDVTDDSFIEKAIEASSRWIDSEANTRFYVATETRKYFVPGNSTEMLILDTFFTSVSSIINGDGSTIGSSDYVLLPLNDSPKYGIVLLATSGSSWVGNSTDLIQVTGSVGYSTSAPKDIELACLEMTNAFYGRRSGENMSMKSVITPAGVVQMPEGVPDWTADTVAGYRRISIG